MRKPIRCSSGPRCTIRRRSDSPGHPWHRIPQARALRP
jgi:hypothetical protein